MNLIEQIRNYHPFNEQERVDKIEILKQLESAHNIFSRDNRNAHMTASAWIVNHTRNKVLMIHHNLYNSWSWLGGHADGDENLLNVAQKEVLEESGLMNITPISEDIYSLEVLTVDGHEKHGSYIPSHLHLNITYLFEADEKETLRIKPDENSDVAWFELNEAIDMSTEPWFQERVYTKLNDKLRSL